MCLNMNNLQNNNIMLKVSAQNGCWKTYEFILRAARVQGGGDSDRDVHVCVYTLTLIIIMYSR